MHKLHHLLHKRKIHHSSNHHTLKKSFSPLGFLKLFFYTKLVEQDSFTPTAPQQMNNSIPPQSSQSATTKKIILSLVALLLILTIGGLVWQRFATQRNKQNPPVNKTAENLYSIKVGNELIYKEDITKMVSLGLVASPSATQPELEKLAQGKIIYESIVLQGAETDGLITLDKNVFNSPAKDYAKREQLVQEVRKNIDKQSVGTHGTVIYLWFNNPDSSITYEEAKQITFTKMKDLQSKVKNKEMTIEQASQLIKNDEELRLVNKNYSINSSVDFNIQGSPNITFFPKFDSILRSLKTGEVTDLYLAKDSEYSIESDKKHSDIDAVYMFGQVSKIITTKEMIDFSTWYEQKQTKYEVKYY